MKLTITKLLLTGALAWVLTGCGALTSDQVLTVEMYGVSKAPASATGDQDPHSETFQLLSVILIDADGTTLTKLFDNEEERIFQIIDRSQIIYSKKIADLEGKSYSGIRVEFDPTVEATEKSNTASFTMASPKLELSQAFKIEKAKSVGLVIKANWGNTMSDGAVTEPEYVLSIP